MSGSGSVQTGSPQLRYLPGDGHLEPPKEGAGTPSSPVRVTNPQSYDERGWISRIFWTVVNIIREPFTEQGQEGLRRAYRLREAKTIRYIPEPLSTPVRVDTVFEGCRPRSLSGGN